MTDRLHTGKLGRFPMLGFSTWLRLFYSLAWVDIFKPGHYFFWFVTRSIFDIGFHGKIRVLFWAVVCTTADGIVETNLAPSSGCTTEGAPAGSVYGLARSSTRKHLQSVGRHHVTHSSRIMGPRDGVHMPLPFHFVIWPCLLSETPKACATAHFILTLPSLGAHRTPEVAEGRPGTMLGAREKSQT